MFEQINGETIYICYDDYFHFLPDGTLVGRVKIESKERNEDGEKMKIWVPFRGERLLTQIELEEEIYRIDTNPLNSYVKSFSDRTIKIEGAQLTNQKGETKTVNIIWPIDGDPIIDSAPYR